MAQQDYVREVVREQIESLRPRLLDLTRRNPLLNTRFSTRSTSHVRAVNFSPNYIAEQLVSQRNLRLIPLPPIDDDNPPDEQSEIFQDALSSARLTDIEYQADLTRIDPNAEDAPETERRIERAMRDQVRTSLGMEARKSESSLSVQEHAIQLGIDPRFDLDSPTNANSRAAVSDSDIQTLLFPNDFERKMNALATKCRTSEQETGVSILFVAFGFLQWTGPGDQSFNAPLVLLPVSLEKSRTKSGSEFRITSDGDDFEINVVLTTYLRKEYGIELPPWEGGSIESYLEALSAASPAALTWKLRKQVAVGVFPSARMAMYVDLDTSNRHVLGSQLASTIMATSGNAEAFAFAEEYETDNPAIESKAPRLVLEADSSQFSTVVDVAIGKNVAVEGPPGTGKSQTIVNAIATAIAEGKKVLFVAEKTAALEVVRARLHAAGLGDLVLPLQTTRSTRQEVIESVRSRISATKPAIPSNHRKNIEEFRKVRSDLQDYLEILASSFGSTGMTIYEVLGRSILTSSYLDEQPSTLRNPFVESIRYLEPSRKETIAKAAKGLAQAWTEAEHTPSHWRGLKVSAVGAFDADQLQELAREAGQLLAELTSARLYLAAFSVEPELGSDRLEIVTSSLKEILPLLSELEAHLQERLCDNTSWPLFGDVLRLFQEYDESYRDACKKIRQRNDRGL